MVMHFIPTHDEKNSPLKTVECALTKTLSTADLPKSYLDLLAEQNGGYVKNMVVPTAEPTSDGLDCAYLHYIYGLQEDFEKSLPYQDFLPEYFIIFSAHEGRYFAFDYSHNRNEPAVRYLEIETDNWQEIAPDFSSFLGKLRPGKIAIPLEGRLTTIEAEHAFLMVQERRDLDELWEHLEDCRDKAWYFKWIAHFAQMSAFRESAFQALENQVLYFRLDLPNNAETVFDLFPEKKEWLLAELHAEF